MTLHPDTLWQVDVVLLRRREWLRQHLSDDGRRVWLVMPEMGVEGPALLQDVQACGPIADGPGRVVTGTFHHRTGMAFDVNMSGESSPIGVTALHPIWSVDRREWIAAIEMQIGERVKTWRGYATVQWIRPRREPEPVYNIEVEGDHVYRVGESGVLAHNTSNNTVSGQQCCCCCVDDLEIDRIRLISPNKPPGVSNSQWRSQVVIPVGPGSGQTLDSHIGWERNRSQPEQNMCSVQCRSSKTTKPRFLCDFKNAIRCWNAHKPTIFVECLACGTLRQF